MTFFSNNRFVYAKAESKLDYNTVWGCCTLKYYNNESTIFYKKYLEFRSMLTLCCEQKC